MTNPKTPKMKQTKDKDAEIIEKVCEDIDFDNWTKNTWTPNMRKYVKDALQKALTLQRAEMEKDLLRKSNHILGCEIESYENILRYRGFDREANMISEVASRIK